MASPSARRPRPRTSRRFRFGTVGRALPGWSSSSARTASSAFAARRSSPGYFKDAEATRAILDADGWLATGDVASIDEDGFVTITDRKKDILVTAGGKNVAPQNIENELKTSKFVSQALVVGDRKPFVAALITLDPDELAAWARERGLGGDIGTLANDPAVHDLVQGIVDEINESHSRFEQIKQFVVLPRDFSPEEGEVTPTLKLRRRVCAEHFATEIEELYSRPREVVS